MAKFNNARQTQAIVSSAATLQQPDFGSALSAEDSTSDGLALLPATTLQPLLGTPPHGYGTLYPLIVSHVASLVTTQVTRRPGGAAQTANGVAGASLPIIVGLGLKKLHASASIADEEDGEELEMLQDEQLRFRQLLDMVQEARVW